MKIADIEIIRLRGQELKQIVRPAWAPGSTWSSRGAVLVKITTDDGLVGWGSPGYGDSPTLEGWVTPRLIGQDPFALERHARIFRNAGGAWGVEIALWDIIGKATGQPLYKLWGGYRDRVPGSGWRVPYGLPQHDHAAPRDQDRQRWRLPLVDPARAEPPHRRDSPARHPDLLGIPYRSIDVTASPPVSADSPPPHQPPPRLRKRMPHSLISRRAAHRTIRPVRTSRPQLKRCNLR
jgi:Mandelate racemase / muconate lactonizing enzyme, N-terminal domain